MADYVAVGESGARVVLTEHFLERARERVRQECLDIPDGKLLRAGRKYPEQKCRALLEGQYWIIFKYERLRNQLVYLTLMPKNFVLPEPSIWIAL